MKKKLLSISLIALIGLGAVATPSCKKYEEGPSISLKSKKARLRGKWKEDKYIDSDGTEVKADGYSQVEFKKGGDMTTSSTDPSFSFSFDGTWKFSDDKKNLITTFSVLGSNQTSTQEIILLKNDQFAVKDTDGAKTYYVSVK